MNSRDEYTSSEMLKIVKQRGYFEIRLIPSIINELSFKELEDIIRKNQVKHRGISYPHIADHKYGKFQRVGNYIESFHHWVHIAEIWRFYGSGQFKHFRGFMEDRWVENPPLRMQWDPKTETPPPENPFFEPVLKIWEMTEMFLFVSRLANELDCELRIEIKLHEMNKRQLQMSTAGILELFGNYTCHTPTIRLKPISISSEELKLEHDELAECKVLEIFEYFDFNESYIPSIIKEEQKKFYSHDF